MTIIKFIRNPKGLTLLELLAVVIILGIITAIAIPTFNTIIANTKKDAHISNAIHIAEAAKMLLNTKSTASDSIIGNPIKLDTLISEGYIYQVKDPSTNGNYYDEQNSTVTISKNGTSFNYFVKLVRISSNHIYTPEDEDVYALTRDDIKIQ